MVVEPDLRSLKGEGDVEVIKRTRVRVECGNCGEDADQRHTYLLPDARRNPHSSGYRGDDISRCCDHDCFTCRACRDQHWRGHEPNVEGYEWCSTYTCGPQYAHLFLRWREQKLPTSSADAKHQAAPINPTE